MVPPYTQDWNPPSEAGMKWVKTVSFDGTSSDGDIKGIAMDQIYVPYNFSLLWHADVIFNNRVFVISFWWRGKRYKFQNYVAESWYHTVSPAAISQALLKEFLKTAEHYFEEEGGWGYYQRYELVKWWEQFSGNVVGYFGKMTEEDIKWFSGKYHSQPVLSDIISNGSIIYDSPLTPVTLKDTKSLDPPMASMALPGMSSRVQSPCKCKIETDDGLVQLWDLVQHLNDKHKWSREAIADWLDELHDSGAVNLEFEPWGELKNEFDYFNKEEEK